jgi:hypothetical protein
LSTFFLVLKLCSNPGFHLFSIPGFHLPRPGEHEPGFFAFLPQNCRTTENQRPLRIVVAGTHDATGKDDDAAAECFSRKLRQDDVTPERVSRKF